METQETKQVVLAYLKQRKDEIAVQIGELGGVLAILRSTRDTLARNSVTLTKKEQTRLNNVTNKIGVVGAQLSHARHKMECVQVVLDEIFEPEK